MLGHKALELVKEMDRAKDGKLPPFNVTQVKDVLTEMEELFKKNQEDVRSTEGVNQFFPGIILRHTSLERNKRCLLAYVYSRMMRIKEARWSTGPGLPDEIRESLCSDEIEWYSRYNKNLNTYMNSIGEGEGLNITQDIKPPKNIYVEVRCLQDYGEFQMEDDVVMLKKDTTCYLPMKSCEHLIRQGILQQLR